jgi:hypothetical protein
VALCTINSSAGRAQPGDPTPNHSASTGWKAADIYVNSTDRSVWVCLDATPGRAVWAEIEVKRAVGAFNDIRGIGEPMNLEGL